MDIYHPVVLFKFSTKRGPSPLLSPPSRRARPQRLLLEERKKKRPGGQRDVQPARQPVSPTDPRRKDEAGEEPAASPPLFLSPSNTARWGAFERSREMRENARRGNGTKDAPAGTTGISFF